MRIKNFCATEETIKKVKKKKKTHINRENICKSYLIRHLYQEKNKELLQLSNKRQITHFSSKCETELPYNSGISLLGI